MTLSAFNFEKLKSRLKKMTDKKQLTFGILCCERLLPNYSAFVTDTGWGDNELIRGVLDFVWSYLDDEKVNPKTIRTLIDQCESAIPDSEDFDSLLTSFAQDACFAICNLLDYLMISNTEKIVLTASYAIDSVDLYVQELEGILPADPDLEQKILSHELMQRELAQQDKDLSLIEKAKCIDSNFLSNLKALCNKNHKGNLEK